jgi:LPXTG-site transpeptidase (sortase) family protein
VRDVGPDGQLGDPAGAYDVVRYDFKLFPGMGGYPGSGGTTVIAGHVDYHTGGPSHPGPISAVFWNIRQLGAGDEIDYTRSDGKMVRYRVDWAQRVGTDTDWNSLMTGTSPEGMLLITCDGTFDASAHEYSNRFAAHATIIQ